MVIDMLIVASLPRNDNRRVPILQGRHDGAYASVAHNTFGLGHSANELFE